MGWCAAWCDLNQSANWRIEIRERNICEVCPHVCERDQFQGGLEGIKSGNAVDHCRGDTLGWEDCMLGF